MRNSEVFNEDCMQVMARYPDKYFDLAVVDPPYGIGITGTVGGGGPFGGKRQERERETAPRRVKIGGGLLSSPKVTTRLTTQQPHRRSISTRSSELVKTKSYGAAIIL